MSLAGPVPQPVFVLRSHASQVNCLQFSASGEELVSGDLKGHVALYDLASFRPTLLWKAHSDSVLQAQLWNKTIISQGRDNELKLWQVPEKPKTLSRAAALQVPSIASPSTVELMGSTGINALGFCKFSLLAVSQAEALVALPSILQEDQVDIFHLPSLTRVHRSVAADAFVTTDRVGMVMALQLFLDAQSRLSVLIAWEDGRVALFGLLQTSDWSQPRRDASEGWELVWWQKQHKEPIMSLALAADHSVAWTVAADHLVIAYDLTQGGKTTRHATDTPGKACIVARDDQKILAIAGWDGLVRIRSIKTFKPLAILSFHRDTVNAVAFAPVMQPKQTGKPARAWVAAGSIDMRISLWEIYPS
ncbi:hypothetical protein E5Q_02350 [Mixia osmundae IAM 14324]|uniref:ASTRA-associated protein 1 n=1 Tax=Mixia osmundae (strain CBS 9802 / IAM 14324 / JCM 22182 / KY 12970) TaxID=764103 RepID=G7DYN3_MIXOS|nr:hypothetical protein E5Q_02350 [Mixia osmundae IAM 14324]